VAFFAISLSDWQQNKYYLINSGGVEEWGSGKAGRK
jgi:hypothetical protein